MLKPEEKPRSENPFSHEKMGKRSQQPSLVHSSTPPTVTLNPVI